MRTIYSIKGNLLNSVKQEKYSGSPYFMFVKNDDLVVNRSLDQNITKNTILFDLETLSKWKSLDKFEMIKGLSKSFLEHLKREYKITNEEVKEVMNNGKNNNKRTHNIREITTSTTSRLTGFTVG